MDLLSIITDPGFIASLLGVMFTLLILSYVMGDNPAFRLAVHAFIGISAGYVTAIVLLQVIANKILVPLVLGPLSDQIIAGIALVLGLFLLAKLFSRTEWVARPIVAFLVGTGAAAAVAGAMLGTMYPQTMASIDMFGQDPLSGAIILAGTVATLAYFQFTLFGKNAPSGKRGWVMSMIAFVGQIFIAITLGALFAGAFSAALTALIDRIQSIVLFIDQFLHYVMPTSLVEGNSLLAVDIGAVTTRAAYFDVVEGRYRFIAMGELPTTANAPMKNVALGVQLAIENLQSVIGKPLIDNEGRLTMPSQPDGIGVDSMVTTISVGPAIKTLVVGLLADVSLRSIEALAQTTYTRIIDTIGLNDQRRPDQQVDAIVRYSPELILIAGGVDGGATSSIQKVLEIIGLAAYLLPEAKRPAVLYAGNQTLAEEVKNSLNSIASHVQITSNVRPSLEVEDLAPAQRDLASLMVKVREQQMPELAELRQLSGGVILPSAYAQGRMIRFLSSYFDSGKGVLSVDAGASAISIGASFKGNLHLNVFPQFGLGEPLAGLLRHTTLEDIARWIPLDIPIETVREYLYQKSLYPSAIPATLEELAIEQAVLRQNLQLAARIMVGRLPSFLRGRDGLLPSFEPILASGAAITGAATPGQKLLMLLDGLQPTGIATLALDQNNLLSMLGAASELNSILPIQVIDSGALAYLATVIAPIGKVNFGTSILRAKLVREDGTQQSSEVKMGNLEILPLETGQTARLELRPLHRADIGLGPGKAADLDVPGSLLGIVIDARGRPIHLPVESDQRRELLKKWLTTAGG